ncbi:MAG: AAA family ATPase [Succinivibrio sp.]|nr:ATP-binding protein [Succinivibrio sp.]MCI7773245.1 ATP-binding protein [Succinivibrio sp.]MDY5188415.1 AAA family ATPase [Succinivibrio sp.]MDY5904174.1 AAA family ATPase [Succinivibrio sp.]
MIAQFLQLPYGKQDFKKIVNDNYYFVDKSRYIKSVFQDDPSQVLLITRPRRFGKTLTMNMFETFLSLNYDDPNDLSEHIELFKDKVIYKDQEFCVQFMGQFPVIAISLKDVQGLDFEDAYKALAKEIFKLASKYRFLQNSTKLDEGDKLLLSNLLDFNLLRDINNLDILKSSLQDLITLLYKHYDKQVILLIDEYDVPLAKASQFNYYKEMVDLISALYSKALKDTDKYVQKAVVTGCLRVAKESIFTGVNNFSVNTVFNRDDDLSTIIGFTDKETNDMLDYYGLSEFKALVKENYDGYNFNYHEIYCPWDVVCFCKDALKEQDKSCVEATSYWNNTSSNDVIKEFLGFISTEDARDMQTLLDGGSVSKKVHVNMNHEELKNHKSSDFWSLLAYTGYLTVAKGAKISVDKYPIELVIPNISVKECFKEHIHDFFIEDESQIKKANSIVQAILKPDADLLQICLETSLKKYISIRDFSSKDPKESYYHAFLNGIFSTQDDELLDYSSNQEQGDGYPDITFKSASGRIGVVIEIKHCEDIKESEKLALNALVQIETKKYYQDFLYQKPITNIYCYGICFYKKSCSVAFKELKK